jgi:hypothetical protein
LTPRKGSAPRGARARAKPTRRALTVAAAQGPLAALLEELGMRRTLARLRAYAEAHGVAAAGDGTNPPASEPASALASDPAAPAP